MSASDTDPIGGKNSVRDQNVATMTISRIQGAYVNVYISIRFQLVENRSFCEILQNLIFVQARKRAMKGGTLKRKSKKVNV